MTIYLFQSNSIAEYLHRNCPCPSDQHPPNIRKLSAEFILWHLPPLTCLTAQWGTYKIAHTQHHTHGTLPRGDNGTATRALYGVPAFQGYHPRRGMGVLVSVALWLTGIIWFWFTGSPISRIHRKDDFPLLSLGWRSAFLFNHPAKLLCSADWASESPPSLSKRTWPAVVNTVGRPRLQSQRTFGVD